MEAKQLSKEALKKYILRRKWQVSEKSSFSSLDLLWYLSLIVNIFVFIGYLCRLVSMFTFKSHSEGVEYKCFFSLLQKTGNAVRAISRFHSMGMMGGVGPKKSPTDGLLCFF